MNLFYDLLESKDFYLALRKLLYHNSKLVFLNLHHYGSCLLKYSRTLVTALAFEGSDVSFLPMLVVWTGVDPEF